jgi:hypothetical protein
MGKVVQMRLPLEMNGTEYDEAFEEFWKVFPKRIGKQMAYMRWREITSEQGLITKALSHCAGEFLTIHLKASPDQILEGAKKYRQRQIDPRTYKLKDDGKFTCMPETWLNQGRWDDD